MNKTVLKRLELLRHELENSRANTHDIRLQIIELLENCDHRNYDGTPAVLMGTTPGEWRCSFCSRIISPEELREE